MGIQSQSLLNFSILKWKDPELKVIALMTAAVLALRLMKLLVLITVVE